MRKKDKKNKKPDKYKPPKKSINDIVHAVADTTITTFADMFLVPGAGSVASRLFNLILAPPVEKKFMLWMEDIGNGLRILEEQGKITTHELKNNDSFISTFTQATAIAVKNHQKEKLDALKNAVLNSALPNPPEASIQQMYLNFVDSFTEWHIRILHRVNDTSSWPSEIQNYIRSGSSPLDYVLMELFPKLKSKRDLLYLIWRVLYSNGLLNKEMIDKVALSKTELIESHTTEFGKDFLKFISESQK